MSFTDIDDETVLFDAIKMIYLEALGSLVAEGYKELQGDIPEGSAGDHDFLCFSLEP